MACPKEDQLLEGDLHVILDKIEADILQITKNGIENDSPNIKHPSTERFQLKMTVLYHSMCISKVGHSSLRHIRAEYKDKKPDISDFHRNIGVSCNTKLKLPKFEDLCIKSTENVLQDE